jgi:hypothetical protein
MAGGGAEDEHGEDPEVDPERDPRPELGWEPRGQPIGFIEFLSIQTALLLLAAILLAVCAAVFRLVTWFYTEFLGDLVALLFGDEPDRLGRISFGTRWDLEPSSSSSSRQYRFPGGPE